MKDVDFASVRIVSIEMVDEAEASGSRRRAEETVPPGLSKCPICGLKCSAQLANHVAAHSGSGYMCSLCGIKRGFPSVRNNHESNVHNFERQPFDSKRKEAIRIDRNQLRKYKSVGTNFDDIQRLAVVPLFKPPVSGGKKQKKPSNGRPTASTSPALNPNEATVDISDESNGQQEAGDAEEEEVVFVNADTPPLSSTPVHSDNTSLSLFNILLLADNSNERNRRLIAELEKAPKILFYDLAHFEGEFGTMPLDFWSVFPTCSLLFLRLRTAEWKGEGLKMGATFRFNLDGDFVHVFFKASTNLPANGPSFRYDTPQLGFPQFMEEMMKFGHSPTVLIIAREDDRRSIVHLESERVVLF